MSDVAAINARNATRNWLQSRDNPLGRRGRELHGWHIGDPRATEADKTANGWLMRPRGAYVMGRNMFGPIRDEWTEP